MKTNVEYYIAAFDKEGRRIASVPTKKGDKKLVEEIKRIYIEAEVVEIIPSAFFDKYLKGYIRGKDGKPIPYEKPVPTKAEIEKQRNDELASKYKEQVESLQISMATALLQDDEELIKDLKEEYKELVEEYKKTLKGE